MGGEISRSVEKDKKPVVCRSGKHGKLKLWIEVCLSGRFWSERRDGLLRNEGYYFVRSSGKWEGLYSWKYSEIFGNGL